MPIAKKTPSKKPALSGGVQRPSGWLMLSKISLTLAACVIPVLVGDWTPDRWEIHKVLALLFVVTIAWLAFFIGQFKQPGVVWKWHPVDWLVLALGGASIVGTITAITPWTSLAGIQGAYTDTAPVTIGFISIYFLGARLFQEQRERFFLWAATLTGIGLALLMQLAHFSGISIFPASLSSDQLFSTLANSSTQVAILAAAVGTIGLLLWPKAKERWAQWGVVLVMAVSWFGLFFLGQAVAWAIFALGMILVVMNQASRPSSRSTTVVIVAVALAATGMLSQFFGIGKYTSLPSTVEVNLSQQASAGTAFAALADRPVLGTGPNTWFDAFVKYRPTSFNRDPRWSGRYLRAGMEWAQLMATQGIVGLSVWIGILLFLAWECWRRLQREPSASYMIGLFMAMTLGVTLFLSTWSFQLLFLAWTTFALVRAKILAAELPVRRSAAYIPAIGFAIVAIIAVVLWYPMLRMYASQIELNRAQLDVQHKAKIETVLKKLQQAVSLDQHNADAGVLLANAYVAKFQDDVQNNDVTTAKKDLQSAQDAMQNTVKHNATNPAMYEAQNNILNSLAGYLTNPEVQANSNFVKLRELEPANPIHDVGYGQTLLVMRARAAASTTSPVDQAQQDRYLQAASAAFNQALEKKPDYPQARFARADAAMASGQYQAALSDLDILISATPTEALFWTSKGTALAKLDKIDLATTAFEQALTLNSSDVSIYLSYSQALSDAKKTTEAKDVLNRGLGQLKDNASLKDALTKLGS